jgi:hypothetical protein
VLAPFGLLAKPEHVTGAGVAPAPGLIGRPRRRTAVRISAKCGRFLGGVLAGDGAGQVLLSCAEHGARLGRSFTGRLYVDG